MKKPIPGYPAYYATYEGEIWSEKNKCFLKPQLNVKGYLRIYLYNQHGRKRFFVHRAVALARIPNPENKPEVNHLDEDIHNNAEWNLAWATKSENALHSIKARAERLKKDAPF